MSSGRGRQEARRAERALIVSDDTLWHMTFAFFAGSGGDNSVMDALLTAGWRVSWSKASYYYTMSAPGGSSITYIEGDIFSGAR